MNTRDLLRSLVNIAKRRKDKQLLTEVRLTLRHMSTHRQTPHGIIRIE